MKFVWDRDHFFCEYCRTSALLPGSPSDIKVVDEKSGVDCALCNDEMQVASLLRERVLLCGSCRGLLIEQERFLKIVDGLRAAATGPPVIPAPLNREELRRKIRCPRCTRAMNTHPYGGPGNIVVDNCETCRLVWLDTGELKSVIDAPGRDRAAGKAGERDPDA
jgi:Zn-finger nucleic acid-binding protein